MKVLSLFSGGGLGDYGLELAGMEVVGQVEIDDYCQKVLKLRWPDVPKWRDIREFDGKGFVREFGQPDIISGGFPCQDISVAGRGLGIKGERSGLWKEMLRIIREIRPRYVLVENVTALLGRGLGVVLGDLAEIGYDAEYDCIPASAVGAPHQRDRVWIVAYSRLLRQTEHEVETMGLEQRGKSRNVADSNAPRERRNERESKIKENAQYPPHREMADTESSSARRLPKRKKAPLSRIRNNGSACDAASQRFQNRSTKTIFKSQENEKLKRSNWWAVEPKLGRVAHGIANRVDRLKLLGNGQVVQVVEWIGERILDFDRNTPFRVHR